MSCIAGRTLGCLGQLSKHSPGLVLSLSRRTRPSKWSCQSFNVWTGSPRRLHGEHASFSRSFSVALAYRNAPKPESQHARPKTVEEFRQKPVGELVSEAKEKEIKAPWHREDATTAPSDKPRDAVKAMTKGKLLTTPSRLLKLILPLPPPHGKADQDRAQPLALLVHPQQPLSYLERLIQSELPTIVNAKGEEKAPAVYFRAEDPDHESLSTPSQGSPASKRTRKDAPDQEAVEVDGSVVKTGKLSRSEALNLRGGPGEGGVEMYDNRGHERPASEAADPKTFVRWSASTEIGDFIRDAARGLLFAIEVEGYPHQILVGVPSFNDRTHYLRKRLRKLSEDIAGMARVKAECDKAAFQGARRVAVGGFGLLLGWWGLVYWISFRSGYGWDLAEPLTYLVGLTTVMCGYLWFLFNNREVSYRAALNATVSRRQTKLYQARGFDLERWENLVEEAKAVRREIKAVASEYNVDWDERQDANDDKVVEVLHEDDKDDKGKERKGGKL